MRVVAAVALLSLFLIAAARPAAAANATPAAAAPAPAACGPGSAETNLEVALAWYAAIGADDLGQWDALMTPDTIYNGAAIADGDRVGFVKDAYAGAIAAFSSLAYAPLAVAARDDLVAVRFRASGVHTGEFRGAQPTGNPVAWDGIGIMRMTCGRIAETWMEVDQIGRAADLGVLADNEVTAALAGPGLSPGGMSPSPFLGDDCGAENGNASDSLIWLWEQVWESGQLAMLNGLLAEDYGDSDPDGDGRTVRADLAAQVEAFRTAMPDLDYTVQFSFWDGHLLVARWTATATMTGPLHGAPPTGAGVSWTGITLVQLDCGRIAGIRNASDLGGLLSQMGIDWQTSD
ncbi:MAG: ester cyclase [Chloroflexota bacterium]